MPVLRVRCLEPDTVRLDALRVVDTVGWPPTTNDTRGISPAEPGEETFGWNLPNGLTRAEVLGFAASQPNIEQALGTGFATMLNRTTEALLTLDDGRDSPARAAAGIETPTSRYGQKMLTTHNIAPLRLSVMRAGLGRRVCRWGRFLGTTPATGGGAPVPPKAGSGRILGRRRRLRKETARPIGSLRAVLPSATRAP
ncbi:MAG: hypothetical protein GY717_06005 [Rhodobacteraceae bacterium]|nr:hypothetical protein [Paracoccaceae bacterium]